MNRYPALTMAASFIKILSVIIMILGIGFPLYFLVLGDINTATRLIAIGYIVASVTVSVILYAMGDFFRCIMDIESNTRPREDKSQQ